MDEKKWMDELRELAEDVEIPESLSPENIRKKLEADGEKTEAAKYEKRRAKISDWSKAKKGGRKRMVRFAEMAAGLLIVCVVGNQLREIDLQPKNETVAMADMNADKTEITAEADVNGTAEKAAAENADMAEAETEMAKQQASGVAEGVASAGSAENLFQKLWDYRNAKWVGENLFYGGSVKYLDADVMVENEMAVMDSYDMGDGAMMEMAQEGAADSAAEYAMTNAQDAAADTASAAGAGDFSQTNLREAGVDEGDIVKTDGEYLYVLKRSGKVLVVSIGEAMEQICEVTPENLEETVCDMYLDGDQLCLVSSGRRSGMEQQDEDVYTVQSEPYVRLLTYDITDRAQPKLAGDVKQEGYYRSSRKTGGYVYLFTAYEPELKETAQESAFLPMVGGENIDAASVYLPRDLLKADALDYLVMASVKLDEPSKTADEAAVVAGAQNFYVSGENIYIYQQESTNTGWETQILKFHYENGSFAGVGAGSVPGYLNDSFSLDEYRGYLRVVSTSYRSGEEMNGLYVLDEAMQMAAKIEDLAEGETIRSARFLGDTGYFVTFRQTDPLFSVDLSDPENPQILGELKVTGFSSYLHPYGENLLLGVGFEADEKTGWTTGVKLSMFDVSDPADVKEIKRYVIKDASYCPGASDYKAILADAKKNLIGLMVDGEYLVFSYDGENGFENLLTETLDPAEDGFWYSDERARGVYRGDDFFVVTSNAVLRFDMAQEFALKEKLEL